jgi:hypothetical protein
MLLAIKGPEMHITTIGSIFHGSQTSKYIKSTIWQGIFGATFEVSLAPGFHDLLTFSDLINLLICIMIVEMNRVLKYKHFKGYVVSLCLMLP